MEYMPLVFALTSLALTMFGYVMIWRSTTAGSVAPVLAPWVVWSSVNFITLAGLVFATTGETAFKNLHLIQQTGYTVGSATILWSIYHRGSWSWTKYDVVVLGIAAAAMLGWFFTGDPLLAVTLALTATGIGAIPLWMTLIHSSKSQGELPWLLWWVGGIYGLLAVSHEEDWTKWLVPVTVLCYQSLTVLLIFRPEIRAAFTR